MANTIEVFVPTAAAKTKQLKVNPRVHELNGKVLGFLWNEKPNGDILLKRLREQITQKYKTVRTAWGQIDGLHVGLENEQVLNELAEKADTVVIAVCDWGSCTTWCIHAAIALEERGKPTVTICSSRFEALAKATANGLGMPDLKLVIVPHPIGGISAEEVIAKADSILDNLMKQLVN